jgi:hypothetical protein
MRTPTEVSAILSQRAARMARCPVPKLNSHHLLSPSERRVTVPAGAPRCRPRPYARAPRWGSPSCSPCQGPAPSTMLPLLRHCATHLSAPVWWPATSEASPPHPTSLLRFGLHCKMILARATCWLVVYRCFSLLTKRFLHFDLSGGHHHHFQLSCQVLPRGHRTAATFNCCAAFLCDGVLIISRFAYYAL